ncbi:hypothetical protein BDQ12DRAFT_304088 [Crucibulum laeve]|uniref:Uncharacterized protein n=1 Tax=Crucibulum laeve TaxID=68775 RepID=A0A5C3LRX7_9AGAR|nr:hypothetical protein BDQ12DRAFT_304088 [Crucibulum laeve]
MMSEEVFPLNVMRKIMECIWITSMPNKERIQFMGVAPLVSRTWRDMFTGISYKDVFIPSLKYYDFYMRLLSASPASPPLRSSASLSAGDLETEVPSSLNPRTTCHTLNFRVEEVFLPDVPATYTPMADIPGSTVNYIAYHRLIPRLQGIYIEWHDTMYNMFFEPRTKSGIDVPLINVYTEMRFIFPWAAVRAGVDRLVESFRKRDEHEAELRRTVSHLFHPRPTSQEMDRRMESEALSIRKAELIGSVTRIAMKGMGVDLKVLEKDPKAETDCFIEVKDVKEGTNPQLVKEFLPLSREQQFLVLNAVVEPQMHRVPMRI